MLLTSFRDSAFLTGMAWEFDVQLVKMLQEKNSDEKMGVGVLMPFDTLA